MFSLFWFAASMLALAAPGAVFCLCSLFALDARLSAALVGVRS